MRGWGTPINNLFLEPLGAGEGAVPPDDRENGGSAGLTLCLRLRTSLLARMWALLVVVYLWLPLSCVPLQACLICLSYLCIFTQILKYYFLLQKNKNKADITKVPLVPLLKAGALTSESSVWTFLFLAGRLLSLIWSIRRLFQTLEGKFVNFGSWNGGCLGIMLHGCLEDSYVFTLRQFPCAVFLRLIAANNMNILKTLVL